MNAILIVGIMTTLVFMSTQGCSERTVDATKKLGTEIKHDVNEVVS